MIFLYKNSYHNSRDFIMKRLGVGCSFGDASDDYDLSMEGHNNMAREKNFIEKKICFL